MRTRLYLLTGLIGLLAIAVVVAAQTVADAAGIVTTMPAATMPANLADAAAGSPALLAVPRPLQPPTRNRDIPAVSPPPAATADSILNSPHDLSVQSPNHVRAVEQEQICIFCHAPHAAAAAAPGWNRHDPSTFYRIYRSRSTEARIHQPEYASRQCLSCHDGHQLLGQVLSRPLTDPIPMTFQTMPPGPSNLTTNLSDDHPISFRYDRALSNADPEIYDPQRISPRLPLGERGEVNCQTCHDPHNNNLNHFLRLPWKRGALCLTCHNLPGWHGSAHATSGKPVAGQIFNKQILPAGANLAATSPGQGLPFTTVADNACANCHQVHGAPEEQQLLRFQRRDENCLVCHDGSVAANILRVLGLPYNHKGESILDRHSLVENPRTMPAHVTCVDCHNPHATRPGPPDDHLLRPRTGLGPLTGVSGVTIHGRLVRSAQFEYEVCLKCHGDKPVPVRPTIPRVLPGNNLRRQISPSAASAHPFVVYNASKGAPSLLPEVLNKKISCSDCHNANDARAFGGTAPNGPHGSIYKFLVALRYETDDFVTESPQTYALCYRCHSRSSILADESFRLHRLHVVTGRSPCSACHDPHGVQTQTHLINFDRSLVSPVPGSAIEYRDRGRFTGSCTLVCHGVNHVNFIYSPTTVPGTGGAAASKTR